VLSSHCEDHLLTAVASAAQSGGASLLMMKYAGFILPVLALVAVPFGSAEVGTGRIKPEG